MKTIGEIFLLLLWIAGIILANGFWSTFFAVVFPVWGYYLVVERFIFLYL
jgi:uncharacterized membrane protein